MGGGVKIMCRTVQFSPEPFQRPLSPCYSNSAGELHHLNLCRETALGEYYCEPACVKEKTTIASSGKDCHARLRSGKGYYCHGPPAHILNGAYFVCTTSAEKTREGEGGLPIMR